MDPKQKAQELMEKYVPATRQFSNEMGWQDDKETAVQCSLIAVDEIIQEFGYNSAHDEKYGFWQSVKEELNKM